jgi:hypothetical protein
MINYILESSITTKKPRDRSLTVSWTEKCMTVETEILVELFS